jgi:hypothetical protein
LRTNAASGGIIVQVRPCILLLVVGCKFTPGRGVDVLDAAAIDAPDAQIDAAIDAAVTKFCPADSHLRLCLSFDADPLPASLPNEGVANVSAQLTNVTRTVAGTSGAAAIDATSTIFVPYSAEVANIFAFEIWFRADNEPPANGARLGILDSNIIPPNVSLFFYRADPDYQLRCGIGNVLISYNAPIVLGTWHYAACVCDADTLIVYLDGTKIGETAMSGCASGGAFVSPDGFTIGSNNNGGPTGVNEQVVGAIDGVRLWDAPIQVD